MMSARNRVSIVILHANALGEHITTGKLSPGYRRTLTEDSLRLQIVVNGVLNNPARIINSYQVCSSWVHVLDAVPWPGASPSQNAIPDPTLGGRFPNGQRHNYPTARTLW